MAILITLFAVGFINLCAERRIVSGIEADVLKIEIELLEKKAAEKKAQNLKFEEDNDRMREEFHKNMTNLFIKQDSLNRTQDTIMGDLEVVMTNLTSVTRKVSWLSGQVLFDIEFLEAVKFGYGILESELKLLNSTLGSKCKSIDSNLDSAILDFKLFSYENAEKMYEKVQKRLKETGKGSAGSISGRSFSPGAVDNLGIANDLEVKILDVKRKSVVQDLNYADWEMYELQMRHKEDVAYIAQVYRDHERMIEKIGSDLGIANATLMDSIKKVDEMWDKVGFLRNKHKELNQEVKDLQKKTGKLTADYFPCLENMKVISKDEKLDYQNRWNVVSREPQ